VWLYAHAFESTTTGDDRRNQLHPYLKL